MTAGILFAILTLHVVLCLVISNLIKLSVFIVRKMVLRAKTRKAERKAKAEAKQIEKANAEANKMARLNATARKLNITVEELKSMIG